MIGPVPEWHTPPSFHASQCMQETVYEEADGGVSRVKGSAMDKTVACLNIEHYRRLLEKESDEKRRQLLLRLLAEEETKLADAGTPNERKLR